jgi:hypothetical protein
MSCSQCKGIELTFDQESIEKELKFYRRDGVDETTRWLVDAIREQGVAGGQLLDIGGGLGGIQHELLASGAAHATHVDASSAYIWGAQEEAKRRGLMEQIEWRHGNFVDIASELEASDIVTLDRVICCYDDMRALVTESARLARRLYGAVYPRDVWWLRAGMKIVNSLQKLFNNPFNVFVHPVSEIEGILEKAGFQRIFLRHSAMWQVALYARS